MKKIQNILSVVSLLGVVVLAVLMATSPSAVVKNGDKGEPGNPGAPGRDGRSPVVKLVGDKLSVDGVLSQSLRGPKGEPGEATIGALLNPDLQSGYLTLGGGMALEGVWQNMRSATNSVCAQNPATQGLVATSSLQDFLVNLSGTSTQGAILTISQIRSSYTDGFSTATPVLVQELASTTIDLKNRPTLFSLRTASTSIMNDLDNSNFDLEAKDAWANQWNPVTDRILVTLDARNIDKADTGIWNDISFSGSCGGNWSTIR